MKEKYKEIEELGFVSAMINSSLDPEEIQRRCIETIQKLVNAEAASFLLVDEKSGELTFRVATGEKGKKLKEVRLNRNEGIAGWVAEHGEALIINDVSSDERFYDRADKVSGFTTRNVICVPVIAKVKLIGVLEGINRKEGNFGKDDLFLLKFLANQVAVAYENARLYRDLKDTFYDTVEALANMIELRDPRTGGHVKNVMKISSLIGRYMGLGREELEHLKLAAILHDIGKIGINDSLLLKGKSLEPDEIETIRKHASHGSELLGRIKQLEKIILGVRHHHERYDGKGYPDGLKKDEIPLMGRIICVADAFDAMTSDRTYRKTLSCAEAMEELKQNRGTQFDPLVVDVFIHAWEKEREDLEDNSIGLIRF